QGAAPPQLDNPASGATAAVAHQPSSASAQPAGQPGAAPTQAPVAAAPAPEATPVYAPRVVVDARFADRAAPVYPDIARQQGAQGTAILLATVGPKGSVLSVSIEQSTGNKWLD